MGQKTDRIKELEGNLSCYRKLLRHIGDTLGGVEFEVTDETDVAIAHQRFLDAIRRMKEPLPPREPGDFKESILSQPRRRSRPTAPGSWDTHDELVDEQIERMEAQGLTKPRESGGVLVRRDDGEFAPLLADLAPIILLIAGELGLNVGEARHDEALTAIHEEIVRVKNQGADVEAESGSKFLSAGKSLGQAIAHDHAQAAELREGAALARTIVARLAAVMQIDKWDKDGTELLERAQRWEGWKHELKRRIRALRASGLNQAEFDFNKGIADELQRQLERLMSGKEMADWLKANEKAGAVKVDAGPPALPYPFEFRADDVPLMQVAHIKASMDTGTTMGPRALTRWSDLGNTFTEIAASRVATEEFARTMNLIVLPILARQRAAQKVPKDATPTE